MNISRNQKKGLVILILCISSQNLYGASNQLLQIKRAIATQNVKWSAGLNWVSKLTPEERKQLGGSLIEPPDINALKVISLASIDSLPGEFDWRNNGGNWLTPVKRQGDCGCCWDFSAMAQVESWWKIKNVLPDTMIDLSEQFLLSCGEWSCEGGYISSALDFIQCNGVPPELCFEYQANDEIPCSTVYENWQEYIVKIPGWGYVTTIDASVEIIKNAVYRHPVSAEFKIYDDFTYYQSGVYEYVYGDYVCNHAVLIVGWNEEEQSWICKNSWGSEWGESGYFRIKWGNCGIGKYIPFIWNNVTGGNAFTITPNNFTSNLTVGDSIIEHIVLKNTGNEVLEFSTVYYTINYKADGIDIIKPMWLNLSNGFGTLQPNESTLIDVIVKTGYLNPDIYDCIIRINTNDSTCPKIEIPYNLEVRAADYDIGIINLQLPADSISIFTQIIPDIQIKNYGLMDAENITIYCIILSDGQKIYEDTIMVPVVISGLTKTTNFKPYVPCGTGVLECIGQIRNYPKDNNCTNNSIRSSININNVVDRFETSKSLWEFKGGWGITDEFSHTGNKSIHVNSGVYPYENNMITIMNYKPGFCYYEMEEVIFSYWTKYETEFNRDICYLEVKTDSSEWIKIDSLSGTSLSWKKREAVLPQLGGTRIFLRFRFISDGLNNLFGVLLDDMEIRPITTGFFSNAQTNKIQEFYNLGQNYPNPFNPSTKIKFDIPKAETVKIEVYNIIGQKIETLLNKPMPAGYHEVEFNVQNLSSGVYLYSIEAGAWQDVKKMILLH